MNNGGIEVKPKKERIWIDARAERFNKAEVNEIRYIIPALGEKDTLLKVHQAIGLQTKSLAIHNNQLLVSYETNKISPAFIDYLLQLNGLSPERQE